MRAHFPIALLLAGFTSIGCGSSGSTGQPPPPPASLNLWTWVTGSNIPSEPGIYGQQGSPLASNSPGARVSPASWTDTSGDLWLFGGYGASASFAQGDLNDLWKFSGGQWEWVSGSQTIEQPGVYGTLGVADSANTPGARYEPASATDSAGHFFLYGGLGLDGTGTRGYLADLWEYFDGKWTWVSGSNIASIYGAGVYGTMGVPSPPNHPSYRFDASSWCDPAGNFWLFGGSGVDSSNTPGIMSDLWEFSNGQWTWVSGSNLVDQFGVYGTLGSPAPTNMPGARAAAASWTDKQGALWLLGGDGNDKYGQLCQLALVCLLNDVWKFDNGQWTWMGGSDVVDQYGIYGTQGTPSSTNQPGARWFSSASTDASGKVWLFGGLGFDSTQGPPEIFGDLNDLWTYSDGQWTWISGSDKAGSLGTYGAPGTASPANSPPARDSHILWIDSSNDLYLFGGSNAFDVGGTGKFNDTWEYQP